MEKGKIKRNSSSKEKNNEPILKYIIIIFSILAIVFVGLWYITTGSNKHGRTFSQKVKLLEKVALNDERLSKIDLIEDNSYQVYFSISDEFYPATVIRGEGKTVKDAWNNAKKNTEKYVIENEIDIHLLKADIMYENEKVSYAELYNLIKQESDSMFRKGISFTENYIVSLLESELNSNGLLDYEKGGVDLEAFNKHLTEKYGIELEELPKEVIIFSCLGYLVDSENETYKLHEDTLNYGLRMVEKVDKELVLDILKDSVQILVDGIKENGNYTYAYYPITEAVDTGYNILRHAGTTWSLIKQYKITKQQELIPVIESSLEYLINENIVNKSEEIAYVFESSNSEIKIGANALVMLAFVEYTETFNNTKYIDIAKGLGNGILELQNAQGGYYHILNYPDFSRKEEVRTKIYDGEATYALTKLYGYTKEEKYLTAAEKGTEYIINNNYHLERSQWVSYTMNEITKYIDRDDFYTFGLKNIQYSLSYMNIRKYTAHTDFEFLLNGYELYERTLEKKANLPYLSEFSKYALVDTINNRAKFQLNSYFFPEFAIYTKNPEKCMNNFFIRYSEFRIRIDDIQHSIAGYGMYYTLFLENGISEIVQQALSKENSSEEDNEVIEKTNQE